MLKKMVYSNFGLKSSLQNPKGKIPLGFFDYFTTSLNICQKQMEANVTIILEACLLEFRL